jgi:hypothetical protein
MLDKNTTGKQKIKSYNDFKQINENYLSNKTGVYHADFYARINFPVHKNELLFKKKQFVIMHIQH